jgi:plasmid stability protein
MVTSLKEEHMSKPPVKRATIYLDDDIHKALRLKAAATSRSISDIVSDAVKYALVEDEEDLSAYADRVSEPAVSYEDFVKELKKNGRI